MRNKQRYIGNTMSRKILENANVLNERFLLAIKDEGTIKEVWKVRYFNDIEIKLRLLEHTAHPYPNSNRQNY